MKSVKDTDGQLRCKTCQLKLSLRTITPKKRILCHDCGDTEKINIVDNNSLLKE